jgi:dipeptidyl aminopeptidase/acylaminoacyl peptidase
MVCMNPIEPSTSSRLAEDALGTSEQYNATRREFRIGQVTGFVILPPKADRTAPLPWVWYAPAYYTGLPAKAQDWLFTRLLADGFAICGTDVGDTFGSPESREAYSAFNEHVVKHYGLSLRVCLLAQSRGGLMWYNWAAQNADKLACIVGIFPVCDPQSYPGLQRMAAAYKMDESQLAAELSLHNPIERLEPLARAMVPILHVHGDSDAVVPLPANSGELIKRYRAMGGPGELIVVKGKGHEEAAEFFQSQPMLDFLIEHGRAGGTASAPAKS